MSGTTLEPPLTTSVAPGSICAATTACGPRFARLRPLGLQSTQAAPNQMGASTKDATRSVGSARLDVDYTSWTAASDDANPTISIDLLQDFTINALSSQGAPDRPQTDPRLVAFL